MLQLRILIVGGGLGGLCASIALRQKGFEVEVFEAAPQLGEIGAGIQVPPNSVRHLKTLGVYDQVSNFPLMVHGFTCIVLTSAGFRESDMACCHYNKTMEGL